MRVLVRSSCFHHRLTACFQLSLPSCLSHGKPPSLPPGRLVGLMHPHSATGMFHTQTNKESTSALQADRGRLCSSLEPCMGCLVKGGHESPLCLLVVQWLVRCLGLCSLWTLARLAYFLGSMRCTRVLVYTAVSLTICVYACMISPRSAIVVARCGLRYSLSGYQLRYEVSACLRNARR